MILAFVFSAGRGSNSTATPSASASGPLPGVTVAAPPAPSSATLAACVKVFAKLPVQLGTLAPRKTETDSSVVAAWGNPAIVLRCGVPRPAIFDTPAAAQPVDVNDVLWQPDPQKNQTVYTAVDRGSIYIDVTVPAGADQPLALLAPAISALKATCTGIDSAGNGTAKLPTCK